MYSDEIHHSNESCWAVLSCGAVYYATQGGSNFYICRSDENQSVTIHMGAVSYSFQVVFSQYYSQYKVLFIMMYEVVNSNFWIGGSNPRAGVGPFKWKSTVLCAVFFW